MANSEKFRELVEESGKSKVHFANILGVSRPYFYTLLQHPEYCTFSQVEILSKELGIKAIDKNDIFLP